MKKSSLTPKVLQVATRNVAEALKLGADLGTIEAGKFADILAVDGDPSADIALLSEKNNIKMVMKESEIWTDRRPGKNKSAVQAEHQSWKIIDYL